MPTGFFDPAKIPSAGDSFHTDLNGLVRMLDKYGVAVLPSVLDSQECSRMQDGMWDAVEEATSQFTGTVVPVSRTDPSTWVNMRELYPSHGSLIQHFGLGNAKFAFDVRQNPKVIEAFERIHHPTSARDLLSSIDGVNIRLQAEWNSKARPSSLWLHTDRAFHTDYTRESVQSWVTAHEVGPQDATLVVLVGSHKLHKEFGQHFGLTSWKKDWFKLETDEQHRFFTDRGCCIMRIQCPAGSQVLWKSTTMHCGAGPATGNQLDPRLVVYCCYAPRSWAKPARILAKQKAIFEGRMTTHDPVKNLLFARFPQTYGRQLQPIKNPTSYAPEEFTSLGKRLFALDFRVKQGVKKMKQ